MAWVGRTADFCIWLGLAVADFFLMEDGLDLEGVVLGLIGVALDLTSTGNAFGLDCVDLGRADCGSAATFSRCRIERPAGMGETLARVFLREGSGWLAAVVSLPRERSRGVRRTGLDDLASEPRVILRGVGVWTTCCRVVGRARLSEETFWAFADATLGCRPLLRVARGDEPTELITSMTLTDFLRARDEGFSAAGLFRLDLIGVSMLSVFFAPLRVDLVGIGPGEALSRAGLFLVDLVGASSASIIFAPLRVDLVGTGSGDSTAILPPCPRVMRLAPPRPRADRPAPRAIA